MVLVHELKRGPARTFRFHLAGGRRLCRGAPSNEALAYNLGKRTCFGLRLGPVVGSWRDPHPSFSCHFVLCDSVCIRQRGQDPYLYGSFHLVLICMPVGTNNSISFSFSSSSTSFWFMRTMSTPSSPRVLSYVLYYSFRLCFRHPRKARWMLRPMLA